LRGAKRFQRHALLLDRRLIESSRGKGQRTWRPSSGNRTLDGNAISEAITLDGDEAGLSELELEKIMLSFPGTVTGHFPWGVAGTPGNVQHSQITQKKALDTGGRGL
jgi:hypothetical protein